MTTKLVPLLIAGALAACGGGGYYTVSGSVTTTTPDLAYVSPGVYVLADYDAPVFYANGSYWYYADGYWYRSNTYTGGWRYVARPPHVIARIDRPRAYIHYRPSNYHARHRPVPSNRIQHPPVVRDHRHYDAQRGGYYDRNHRY